LGWLNLVGLPKEGSQGFPTQVGKERCKKKVWFRPKLLHIQHGFIRTGRKGLSCKTWENPGLKGPLSPGKFPRFLGGQIGLG